MKNPISQQMPRFLSGLLFIGLFASVSMAQDLRYNESTRMRLEGLGIVGRALGRVGSEEEVFLKGDKMLVRSEDGADTVTDLESDRFIYINNDDEEYAIVTFEEMAEEMGRMMEEGAGRMQEAEREAEAQGTEQDFDFDFSAEATGERDEINGYDAEQMLMTLRVAFTVEGEGEEGEVQTARGNFYALVDTWLTEEVPNYDQLSAFREEQARKMGEAMGAAGGAGSMMEAMQTAMQQDERMGAAMAKVAEEMAKVEGAPVRTVTYYILAPEGEDLNVDLALGREEKPARRRGLGGLVGGALRNRGINVGGADEESEEGKMEISEQKTLLSITTEMTDIETDNLDPEIFLPREDYQQVEWPGFGGR